jgi:hypothetical protein
MFQDAPAFKGIYYSVKLFPDYQSDLLKLRVGANSPSL